MIDKKTLEEAALKLNLTMSDAEYETLMSEFQVMLTQMEYINSIEGISNVQPMHFPFPVTYTLREDENYENISTEDVLKNAKCVEDNRVSVPKVVGEENE